MKARLRHGKRAVKRHARIGGRTGSIRHKQRKGMLIEAKKQRPCEVFEVSKK